MNTEVANIDRRTKVNATVLGAVHWVMTPFALLSKVTALLAPDKQQQRSRAIETAVLNMAREGGKRTKNEFRKGLSL